ncbi:DoxX family protein [Leptospira perolatii]|uniref:DoxX family protein n=2 Tax=Leptospira perolatii TaxID=2023191 RepID=A0A2M9ZPM3_9LEPT|nr:DoxX family protein [Leptospira perolatii]PJZ74027.1 DoxX family protein [Leptospira perolatii]
MKIATITVRSLMGLLFTYASIAILFKLVPQPEQTGNMKIFMDGIAASGYLLTLLKLTELACGIALLTGYFVPLALIVISPVIVNIFFVHLFLAHEGLPIAIFLVLANSFLGYSYRKHFVTVLTAKKL